jgi:16S rRNA (uracil1498-N3)-methyltransferase
LQEALGKALPGNRILLNFGGHRITDQLQSFSADQAFCMLIGPEGGFSESELEFARKADFESYSLGPRVLRMETAAISIVTLIQHYFGDMS